MQSLINAQRHIITQEIEQLQRQIQHETQQRNLLIEELEQAKYERIEEINKLLYGV